jgi:hypothetical protein
MTVDAFALDNGPRMSEDPMTKFVFSFADVALVLLP